MNVCDRTDAEQLDGLDVKWVTEEFRNFDSSDATKSVTTTPSPLPDVARLRGMPEDEIQRLKAELAAEGFEYGGGNFSEEDLAAHATAASRKAVLKWVREEMEPLGKKTYRAGGVTKKQEKKDKKIKKELKEKQVQEEQKRELEMIEYNQEVERRKNMKVSMNLATNRKMEERKMESYDALQN